MFRLTDAEYAAIRTDTTLIADAYSLYRDAFVADLNMPGLSEVLVKSAFASVIAYGLLPYGESLRSRFKSS
jgi:hypothetical protein